MDLYDELEDGDLEHWRNTQDGRLAYLLLTDTFPRILYKGTRMAFKYDRQALTAARLLFRQPRLVDNHPFAERVFLLMPLMHSEHVEDVQLCYDEAERQTLLAEEAENKEMVK